MAVIVNYKSAHLVRNLLASLALEREAERSNGVVVRAVIVDNASGEASSLRSAVIELSGHDWIAVIEAPQNGGFSYGNNIGFRHGFSSDPRPDFFFLLNPDTEVRPGAIRPVLDFFDQRPDAGVVGSSLEGRDGQPWPYAFRYPSLLNDLDCGLRFGLVSRLLRRHLVVRRMGDLPEQVDWFPGAAMMVRREVVERLGGMDERYFLYFEETDFCRKVKSGGFTNWYLPASRVMHIAGQSTGVTGEHEGTKRLPPYWFESRRRYFAKNYGLRYAMATDAVLLVASAIGQTKDRLKRKGIPRFTRDLLRHSVLRAGNRFVAPAQEWRPTLQKEGLSSYNPGD